MYKHVIPQNISDNGDLFDGAIKKRNLIEAAGIFIFGALFLKFALFPVPFLIKAVIFVFMPLMPTVIALIGIGDQSLFEALGTLIRYKKMKNILPYSLYTDSEQNLMTKKEAKEKEKEDRKALKRAKKRKKTDPETDSKTQEKKKKLKKNKEEKKNEKETKKKRKEKLKSQKKRKKNEKDNTPSWDDAFF